MVHLIPLLFADDLNAFKLFPNAVSNDTILEVLRKGQADCHKWGGANQVEFEASKETFTIISKTDSYGPGFKLLGVFFRS